MCLPCACVFNARPRPNISAGVCTLPNVLAHKYNRVRFHFTFLVRGSHLAVCTSRFAVRGPLALCISRSQFALCGLVRGSRSTCASRFSFAVRSSHFAVHGSPSTCALHFSFAVRGLANCEPRTRNEKRKWTVNHEVRTAKCEPRTRNVKQKWTANVTVLLGHLKMFTC